MPFDFDATEWAWLAVVAALVALYGIWATISYAVAVKRNGEHDLGWLRRVYRNPSAIGGLVGAAATLGAAFGLDLSSEQVGAIAAFLTVLVGFVVRHIVTPAYDPDLPEPDAK